ncbi:bifunctional protein FolD 2 [Sesamum indicum]|uniref:Bifunctional protein FolD 2 n=1 Tax=Sesamum indicum TaxID=4182 RepID=A0A6I9TCL7_SESIN|nr:bifunctional protein FolD 2 [Sesamum indicum]
MGSHRTSSTVVRIRVGPYYTLQFSTENVHEFRVYVPDDGDLWPFQFETSHRYLPGAIDREVLWPAGVLMRDNARTKIQAARRVDVDRERPTRLWDGVWMEYQWCDGRTDSEASSTTPSQNLLSPDCGVYLSTHSSAPTIITVESILLLCSLETMSDHKATLIDGKAIAQTIRSEIAAEVCRLSETYGKVPGLAVVIVGKRKDSQSYVNMKRKACAEVGIKSVDLDLPEEVSESELISKVHELNANPDVHGILVQLPLPKHINEEKILSEISLDKDVDGFHPLNIGKLAMKGRDPLFVPCTPKGCLELLSRSGVSVKGKNAVVVGRSNIVGLPVSLLLLKEDATVTIVHSRTKEPESIVRSADIVIAAAGQAMMIKGSWIKPGAAVIDVGTNAVDDPSKKSGYRLVGDDDFQEASKVAGWITPVPGGVGPMTVAMLLKNTLDGAKRVIEQ